MKHRCCTSIVKDVRKECESVEKILKLSHIPCWNVDIVAGEKSA